MDWRMRADFVKPCSSASHGLFRLRYTGLGRLRDIETWGRPRDTGTQRGRLRDIETQMETQKYTQRYKDLGRDTQR